MRSSIVTRLTLVDLFFGGDLQLRSNFGVQRWRAATPPGSLDHPKPSGGVVRRGGLNPG